MRQDNRMLINEYKNYVGDNMGLYKNLLDGIYKYNNNKFLGLRSTNDKFKYYLKLFQKINNQIKVETSNDFK